VEAPVKPGQFEDAVLVRQIQAGDLQTFAQLVSKYQDRVFNTCWRICGNLEDARDITQEAFLKALESIAAFRGESGFYTWLFRIAVNLALAHRRRASRRAALSIDQPGEFEDSQGRPIRDPAPHDPGRALDEAETRRRIAEALRSLEEPYRVAVVLRDIEGLDYEQIARILEVPKGTVKSRIARGRDALRAALERDDARDGKAYGEDRA
jgi:RNA polymerase sigma-70 factor (ECF subfamily)